MSFIAVKDLKRSTAVWQRLAKERHLVVTRDGQPLAILSAVQPERLESDLAELRRAKFSAAVSGIRRRARTSHAPSEQEINAEIRAARRGPGRGRAA
jgi:hypothetical protein